MVVDGRRVVHSGLFQVGGKVASGGKRPNLFSFFSTNTLNSRSWSYQFFGAFDFLDNLIQAVYFRLKVLLLTKKVLI